MKFKASERNYYGALALAQMTPKQWEKSRESFRKNMLEASLRVIEAIRIYDNSAGAEAAIPPNETPHVTDGSPCWCNPEVIHVEGKRRGR